MSVTTRRWRRGEQLGGWGRRWEIGALRWWRWEFTTGLLHLTHFGLKRQRQVGQIELAWFRGSRGSRWLVLGRRSSGGVNRAVGGRWGVALGSKFAEQIPPGFLIGG